ncbi:hypothetical protein DTO164E3_6578 [Paecilomyces variotii]|nr:hypothetical protein DTO164E3_6578 [Paecilomyces variotii]KAJ9208375.1 hypothetical protein DTO032I3_1046 [Paecilomyces variotii]KAJ9282171.1 hypothetical protein DTO021D3_923 [Paecilomyces variotii]KAJ9342838.1 hypothetical protein DTO027B6_4709 [Paecilomyces variotii]KAJ9386551.1 hypothetical protein DTO032I4_3647 [Paecilomyces variotii]
MATTTTEGNEVQATAMAYTSPSRVTSYNPLSGLPANHATIQFSTFKRVKDALESIYKSLQDNDLEGNQYLVVLGLSDHALNKLKHEDHPLGMKNCRLELDANMAIIKVKPGYSHEVPLGVFTRLTDSKLRLMGLPLLSYVWARATTHEPTASMKAKEADESFHPESRLGNWNAAFPWPTLVIEIGNAQSLAKLREDVRWWFENSEGDVRIVLLMIVHQRSRTITLEKWQLAPPNTPPLTRASINAFRQAVPPTMPPLVRQIAVNQQPYCIQETTITRTAASAQLMLPFHALLDDAPVPPQSDLVFTQAELVLMVQTTWR